MDYLLQPMEVLIQSIEALIRAKGKGKDTGSLEAAVHDAAKKMTSRYNESVFPTASPAPPALSIDEADFMRFVITQSSLFFLTDYHTEICLPGVPLTPQQANEEDCV
ncbi:hypothetical protein HD806DRAFT_539722 [Xylariaceae sp. AK1471]|nr:hypothetical protein HD806DRAFT_539722 [Xylariaceae sp. AK1471]